MAKTATTPTKPSVKTSKKPPVDPNTLFLRELKKTKKTISDASVLISKDLAAVMAVGS